MPSISGPRSPSSSDPDEPSNSTSPSESLAYLLQSQSSPRGPRHELDPRSMGVDRGIGAVLYALEAWKAQAAERNARTESKILLSLLALEQRIAQATGDLGSPEARLAGTQWRGRAQYTLSPPDPRSPATLETVEQRLWELQAQVQESKVFGAERLAELAAKSETQYETLLRMTDLQEHSFSRLEKLRARFETATRKTDGTMDRLIERVETLEDRLSMEQNGLLDLLAARQATDVVAAEASNARILNALDELAAALAGSELPRSSAGRSPMALIRGGDPSNDEGPPPTGQARSGE